MPGCGIWQRFPFLFSSRLLHFSFPLEPLRRRVALSHDIRSELLFFTKPVLGSQNCPCEMASKKGHGSAAQDLHKRVNVSQPFFSIQISEKPVAPPLDIPSRHPNQIGASSCALRSVVITTAETVHF